MKALFSAVLNMSLTGSLVILAVLGIRLLLRKAPKVFSYALWLVVLFRLLCPLSLVSGLSLIPKPAAPPSSGPVSQLQYLPEQTDRELPPIPDPLPESSESPEVLPDPVPQKPTYEVMDILGWIWIVGVLIMTAQGGWRFWKLRRKLTVSVRYRGNIYLADDIPTPFVLGLFRPRIYLPSYLDKKERLYIITHEREHIRRRDQIFKFLAYLALSLHWFNPLVWAAFLLSARDMEMSCDEAVIRRLGPQIRAEYSASLLRLATGHRIIAGAPLAFGEGDTKGRVKNMANWKKPGKPVLIISLLLCLSVLVSCGMNPKTGPAESEPTEPPATEAAVEATEPYMMGAAQPDTSHPSYALMGDVLTFTQTGATVELRPEEAGPYEAYFTLCTVKGNRLYPLPLIGGEEKVFTGSSNGGPLRLELDWEDTSGILAPGKYVLTCVLFHEEGPSGYAELPFTLDSVTLPVPKEQEAIRLCYGQLLEQMSADVIHYRVHSPEGITTELWQYREDYKLLTTYDPDYDSAQNPQSHYQHQNFVSRNGYAYSSVHSDPEDLTSPVIGWELCGLNIPNPGTMTRSNILSAVCPDSGEALQFTGYLEPEKIPDRIHFYAGKDPRAPRNENYEYAYYFDGSEKLTRAETSFHMPWKDGKEYYEYTYYFDGSGNLTRAEAFFHMPWKDGKEYYDEPFTLDFFPSGDREILDQIQSFREDLKVRSFSWAEDQKLPDTGTRTVTREGFVCTASSEDIQTPEQALNAALREMNNMQPLSGDIRVAYDPGAQVWRVTFEALSAKFRDLGLYERRDIYMGQDGRTRLILFDDGITLADRNSR